MANGLPPGPGVPSQPLPGWLGSGVQVVTQVGVPTVFAGVLLWFVLGKVGHTMEAIEQGEETRVRIIAAMQDTLIAALDRQGERFEKAIYANIAANKEATRDLHDYIREFARSQDGQHGKGDK